MTLICCCLQYGYTIVPIRVPTLETRDFVVIPNENSSYLRAKFRDVRRSSIRRCLFSPVIVVLDAPFGFTDKLQLWIRKLVYIFDRRNPSESPWRCRSCESSRWCHSSWWNRMWANFEGPYFEKRFCRMPLSHLDDWWVELWCCRYSHNEDKQSMHSDWWCSFHHELQFHLCIIWNTGIWLKLTLVNCVSNFP